MLIRIKCKHWITIKTLRSWTHTVPPRILHSFLTLTYFLDKLHKPLCLDSHFKCWFLNQIACMFLHWAYCRFALHLFMNARPGPGFLTVSKHEVCFWLFYCKWMALTILKKCGALGTPGPGLFLKTGWFPTFSLWGKRNSKSISACEIFLTISTE